MIEERTDERNLAENLGVARVVLRGIRANELEAGTDWERGHGGRIEYTAGGIERVREILANSAPENPPQEGLEGGEGYPDPNSSPKTPPAPEDSAPAAIREVETGRKNAPTEAKVTRLPMNSRILFARIEGDEADILVRVRDNALFVRGMVIPVLQPPAGGAWQLGRKHPRWKGRW